MPRGYSEGGSRDAARSPAATWEIRSRPGTLPRYAASDASSGFGTPQQAAYEYRQSPASGQGFGGGYAPSPAGGDAFGQSPAQGGFGQSPAGGQAQGFQQGGFGGQGQSQGFQQGGFGGQAQGQSQGYGQAQSQGFQQGYGQGNGQGGDGQYGGQPFGGGSQQRGGGGQGNGQYGGAAFGGGPQRDGGQPPRTPSLEFQTDPGALGAQGVAAAAAMFAGDSEMAQRLFETQARGAAASWLPGAAAAFARTRCYFAVSHRSVAEKLRAVLFPWTKRHWRRKRADELGGDGSPGHGHALPMHDANAPDMYRPRRPRRHQGSKAR